MTIGAETPPPSAISPLPPVLNLRWTGQEVVEGPVYSLAWSPAGGQLAAGSRLYNVWRIPGSVVLWDVQAAGD